MDHLWHLGLQDAPTAFCVARPRYILSTTANRAIHSSTTPNCRGRPPQRPDGHQQPFAVKSIIRGSASVGHHPNDDEGVIEAIRDALHAASQQGALASRSALCSRPSVQRCSSMHPGNGVHDDARHREHIHLVLEDWRLTTRLIGWARCSSTIRHDAPCRDHRSAERSSRAARDPSAAHDPHRRYRPVRKNDGPHHHACAPAVISG